MTLNWIDWMVIAAFFAVLFLIPVIVKRGQAKSASEYFLSGRSMPWWLIGFSMVAATTATDSANFFTQVIRKDGLSGNWVMWSFLLTGLLTVFVYAKLWIRTGVTTDIEFYELRYAGRSAAFLRGFRSVYLGVIFNVLVMANVILAAIKIANVMFGVSPGAIMWVTAITSIFYAAAGGIRGAVWGDLYLFVVIMTGAVAAMCYALGLPEVGGIGGIVANPATASRLSIFPDFGNTDLLVAVFIVPLAVQWWSVWKAGSEPGGGGYIVQKMLTAKSENHAIAGTLFFNVLNWVLRPWPWYIVGLASVIVFPDLDAIRQAFPHVDPRYVGGDMAYPAMLTKVPNGWLGVVAASMAAALFSTVAAHINMGSSYLVNDFWRRFVRPAASDRECILMARLSAAGLVALACALAPCLDSARTAFDIMLLIGAGTGPIFLLRWFWMRVNAWSEITGMVVSFVAAIYFQLIHPRLGMPEMAQWQRLLATILITTAAWLAVTFLTPRTAPEVVAKFKAAVRAEGRDVGRGLLAMSVAAFAIFSAMYAVGAWIYGWWLKAALVTVASTAGFAVLALLVSRKSRATGG